MDTKMVDMKQSKAAMRKMNSPMVGNAMDYPWGLTINLDSAALDKLGMKDLPDAGEECMITATGKVTRVSQSAGEKAASRSVEIQITKLHVACEDMDDKAWEKVKADRKAAA